MGVEIQNSFSAGGAGARKYATELEKRVNVALRYVGLVDCATSTGTDAKRRERLTIERRIIDEEALRKSVLRHWENAINEALPGVHFTRRGYRPGAVDFEGKTYRILYFDIALDPDYQPPLKGE